MGLINKIIDLYLEVETEARVGIQVTRTSKFPLYLSGSTIILPVCLCFKGK